MNKSRARKLSLSLETVKRLSVCELQELAGGYLGENGKVPVFATWGIYCWTRDSCFGSCIC